MVISMVTAGAANQNRPKKDATSLDLSYTARTLARRRKDVALVAITLVIIIKSQKASQWAIGISSR